VANHSVSLSRANRREQETSMRRYKPKDPYLFELEYICWRSLKGGLALRPLVEEPSQVTTNLNQTPLLAPCHLPRFELNCTAGALEAGRCDSSLREDLEALASLVKGRVEGVAAAVGGLVQATAHALACFLFLPLFVLPTQGDCQGGDGERAGAPVRAHGGRGEGARGRSRRPRYRRPARPGKHTHATRTACPDKRGEETEAEVAAAAGFARGVAADHRA